MDTEIGISAAARILGISVSTLKRLSDESLISSIRTPGGHRRFELAEVHLLQQRLGGRAPEFGHPTNSELIEQLGRLLVSGDANRLQVLMEEIIRTGQGLPTVIDRYLAPAIKQIINSPGCTRATIAFSCEAVIRVIHSLTAPSETFPFRRPNMIGCALGSSTDELASRCVAAALRTVNIPAMHFDDVFDLHDMRYTAEKLGADGIWLASWDSDAMVRSWPDIMDLRGRLPLEIKLIIYGNSAVSSDSANDMNDYRNTESSNSLQVLCSRVLPRNDLSQMVARI